MTTALLQAICEGAVAAEPSEAVRARLAGIVDWDAAVDTLAFHGLLPVAHRVLRLHGVPCAPPVRRRLAAGFLRSVARARAQESALVQLITALRDADVDHVALKGAAIARIAYPDVALRPMDDLDILVAPDQVSAARDVLLALGYEAPMPTTRFERLQHQQPTAQRDSNGERICVEVHHTLFNLVVGEHVDMSSLSRPFAHFDLGGVDVAYLGIEGLMWMQHRGLRKLAEPLRAIHLLDLALLAQRLPGSACHPSLRCRYPSLWHALLALDEWLPLGRSVRQHLGFPPRRPAAESERPGEDYSGWPRPRQGAIGSWFRQSLWPPLWWGRFLHGLPSGSGARLALQRRHAMLVASQSLRRIYLGPAKPGHFFEDIRLPPAGRLDEPEPRLDAPAPGATPGVQPEPPPQPPARCAALVTCMYNGLSGTSYGGRLNRDNFYRESLATIAAAGTEVHCFVSAVELDAHRDYFSARPGVYVWHVFEVSQLPHSHRIQQIKAARADEYAGLAWNERCVEIMWGKFHMLRTVLDQRPDLSHVFWIDAGLANVNIISTRYTTEESLAAGRLHDVHRAFPQDFCERLCDLAGERIAALESTVAHNPGVPARYNERPYGNSHALIAGLIGGPRDAVLELCARFERKCERVLDDEALFFEESLLTGIHADHPELFRTYTFDSWYHEGWACHDPALRSFSQFFDSLLGTPQSLPAPRFPWA